MGLCSFTISARSVTLCSFDNAVFVLVLIVLVASLVLVIVLVRVS